MLCQCSNRLDGQLVPADQHPTPLRTIPFPKGIHFVKHVGSVDEPHAAVSSPTAADFFDAVDSSVGRGSYVRSEVS